jgi:hypothetical protein
MFNDNARPCLVSLFPQFKTIFKATIENGGGGGGGDDDDDDDDSNTNTNTNYYDSSIGYAIQNIDTNEFNFMIDAMENEYVNERNTLIHNDTHVFNLLVEKKPPISALENFGPTGNIVSTVTVL